MEQAGFFDVHYEHTVEQGHGLGSLLTGPSVLSNNLFSDVTTYRGQSHTRSVAVGERVAVHPNLLKKPYQSVKALSGEFKNLVVGNAKAVLLTNVTCKGSVSGQQRVIAKGNKNVHAFAIGEFAGAFDGELVDGHNLQGVSYNPFRSHRFYDLATFQDLPDDAYFPRLLICNRHMWIV